MKALFIRSLAILPAVAILLTLTVRVYADPTTLNYNPAAVTSIGFNPCGNFPLAGCMTTAYFNATSLDAMNGNSIAALFQSAFNAWNPGGWTDALGAQPGGTFNMTGNPVTNPAAAGQFGGVTLGGLTIEANLNGLTLPALGAGDQLLWVQGLYINYAPGPNAPTVAPYYAMDTATLSSLVCTPTAVKSTADVFCPPAYPYQYNNNMFYDQPQAFYQAPGQTQAFFNADAYLAVVNYNNKSVSLLDGFAYGFQNIVSPEPESLLLFGSGLFLLAIVVRRRVTDSV